MKRKKSTGFTLIEVMVAVTVLVVGLLAILGLLVFSIRAGETSFNRARAAYLAQEGIEVVRNLRDSNVFMKNPWSQGLVNSLPGSSRNCIAIFGYTASPPSWSLSTQTGWDPNNPPPAFELKEIDSSGHLLWLQGLPAGSGTNTNYFRNINISRDSADKISVVATVVWRDQFGIHNLKMEEELYNWF